MIQSNNTNSPVVDDAAANLFWTLAETVGVRAANEAVINSAGRCLLDQPFTSAILAKYKLVDLKAPGAQEVLRAITEKAEWSALNEVNMTGMVYLEDAQTGRAPSAMAIDFLPLNLSPVAVQQFGPKIERVGCLCIRHPLPAVVFTTILPEGRVIEVEDTSTALGFSLPILMTIVSVQPAGDNVFVLTGYFHIPVPDRSTGDLWSKAIQNSSRFVAGITFQGGAGDSIFEFTW